MHAGCVAWVEQRVAEHGLADGKTLEIGSYRENGDATVREFFSDYVGLDMRAGPNVDVVGNANHLLFPLKKFDSVLCLNTLEHDEHPWMTLKEVFRVTKPGGYLLLAVPGFGFPKHDHPSDYWRFSEEGVHLLVRDAGYSEVATEEDNGQGGGWFCLARK